MSFNWKCPFCNQNATITEERFEQEYFVFGSGNKYGRQRLTFEVVICPNEECQEYVLSAFLNDRYTEGTAGNYRTCDKPNKAEWQLVPRSLAKVFPDYVPKAIRDDYEEACLICDLSPKASATLARRCLQGIIRDFWCIKKGRLIDEINALEKKVEKLTWLAIDAVRSVGNIGAHMEKDIDIIIDVEPGEATKLISLIEILIEDWYIARNEKQKHLESIINLAEEKEKQKTDAKKSEEE